MRPKLLALSVVSSLALSWCDNNDGNKIWDFVCEIQQRTSQTVESPQVMIPSFALDSSLESSFPGIAEGTPYRLPNTLEWNTLSVHFITNQSRLDIGDTEDLDKFIEFISSLDGTVSILLEGYADARGTIDANIREAELRNQAIQEYIESKLSEWKVIFESVSFGEAESSQNVENLTHEEKLELRKDRRVDITLNHSMIQSALDRNIADGYVLDASGSMTEINSNGNSSWQEVLGYNFPTTSSIFTFTTANNDCVNNISDQIVDWQTPLIDSMIDIIQTWTFDGKTLTLLSDGGDNESIKSLNELITIAQEKSVKINVIGIGNFDQALLQTIAESTGGTFTFQN